MSRALPLAVLTTTAAAALLGALPSGAAARDGSRLRPTVEGRDGIVVSESYAASRAGRAVLEQGGNAIDAAVTTVFALGAARPQSCGIGGGGFMVYRSASGATRSLDFRETAPAAYTPRTLDPPGLHKAFTGHLPVGVPGTLAGMDSALARYGTIDLATALAPAERLARTGVEVPASLSKAMTANAARLKLFPASSQFLRAGSAYAPGDTLRLPELAASLRRIQREGPGALYGGTIGRRIVRDMVRARPQTKDAGLLRLSDLKAYRAIWRTPLEGSYRGRQVVAAPPPSSGGTTILETLNLLEGFDLKALGQDSADVAHLEGEAQRIAWADRNAYVADPGFVGQPTEGLIAKAYANTRRPEIALDRTKAHAAGTFVRAPRAAGEDPNPNGSTTHVSVIDRDGNAVAVTCTVEQEFGSAVVAPGTGVLLNNELTDFSAAGTANQPQAGKRPRSSIAPTIVVQGGKPILVTGGAGGSRIIMGVLQTILGRVDFGLGLNQATDAERVDSQGTSTLSTEQARLDPGAVASLQARGWTLAQQGEYALAPRVNVAGIEPDGATAGASDSRTDQAALAARR